MFSVWRPQCPSGYEVRLVVVSPQCNCFYADAEDIERIIFRYVSIGDVAHVGTHPPHFAAVYRTVNGNFALPLGYDLVGIQRYFFRQMLLVNVELIQN